MKQVHALKHILALAISDGYKWAQLVTREGRNYFIAIPKLREAIGDGSISDKYIEYRIPQEWGYVRSVGCIKKEGEEVVINLHPFPVPKRQPELTIMD